MSDITYAKLPADAGLPPGQYRIDTPKSAPLYEQALVGLWFFTTLIPFRGDSALLYPLVLYFTGFTVLNRRQIVPVALKSWPLFTLPVMTMLSGYWAVNFQGAFKLGVFMMLTAVIAIYIATRLSRRQIIQALFFVATSFILMAAAKGGLSGLAAVVGEKNIFANRVMIASVTCLAVAYDKNNNWILRLPALPLAALGLFMALRAGSATNLVFALGSTAVLTGVWLFWSRFGAIAHLRSFMMMVLLAGGLAAVLFVLNTPDLDLQGKILNALGKDSSLTGRTMLWNEAARVSEERPWLGLGAGSFWIYARGDAQTILELSFKEYGTSFSFHSSYWEVRVHLGYVGLSILILILGWCIFNSVRAWLIEQSLERSFFLLMTGIVLVATFTEAVMFSAFETTVTLFYISAVAAVAGTARTTILTVEAPPQAPRRRPAFTPSAE